MNCDLVVMHSPTVNHELIPLVGNKITFYWLREDRRKHYTIIPLTSELIGCDLTTLANKISIVHGLRLVGIDGRDVHLHHTLNNPEILQNAR